MTVAVGEGGHAAFVLDGRATRCFVVGALFFHGPKSGFFLALLALELQAADLT
jgi:hypothetical protein